MDADMKQEFDNVRLEIRELGVSLREEVGKSHYTFWVALVASIAAMALVVAAKMG